MNESSLSISNKYLMKSHKSDCFVWFSCILKRFQREIFLSQFVVLHMWLEGLKPVDLITDHTQTLMMGLQVWTKFWDKALGQREGRFTCICSCRAAAPGAEQCVCAIREGGCGCNAPRWAAAGGSAQTRSGQSFHKTPEDREEKWQDS